MLIADYGRILKVDMSTGRISTVVSLDTVHVLAGCSSCLETVISDAFGNLFMSVANRILRMDAKTGRFLILAGNGTAGFAGDGGRPLDASLNSPSGMAFDKSGTIFVADQSSRRVRKITFGNEPILSTIDVSAAATPGIVNAASYEGDRIAPGEIVTLFGINIGPVAPAGPVVESGTGRVAAALSGYRVLFNGTPGPILYASSTQTSVVVPYEVNGQDSVRIRVESPTQASNEAIVPIASSAPGIFTANGSGKGLGAILFT